MAAVADLLPVALEAVELASGMMRGREPGALTAKGDRDFASEVDFAIERQVRALLRERTPQLGFLGEEEGGAEAAGELTWALDPVDGTVNFVHGVPLCGVSLGLLHRGEAVLGVIDLPFLAERYWATDGGGAFNTEGPIRSSGAGRLRDALVVLGDFSVVEDDGDHNGLRLAVAKRLAAAGQRVRMLGSAAMSLAWVGAGRIDAMVMLSNKPWDTAAGVVIAREAGALVVDRDGSHHTAGSVATLAATGGVLPELLAVLHQAEADIH